MLWGKKTPYIKFRYRKDHELLPRPMRASKSLPDWFKSLARRPENFEPHEPQTVKRCVPVLDAASNGYYIPAWCDFAVSVAYMENEETSKRELALRITPASHLNMFEDEPIGGHPWEQVGNDCPIQSYDLGKILRKFQSPWVIETSKGWSCLFKSPPHHYSNIRIMEGVVDTDTYHRMVNFPFFWDGNKEGEFLIKAGTPLIHVIPFKREAVELQFDTWDETQMAKDQLLHGTMFHDSYRKLWWHKRKTE